MCSFCHISQTICSVFIPTSGLASCLRPAFKLHVYFVFLVPLCCIFLCLFSCHHQLFIVFASCFEFWLVSCFALYLKSRFAFFHFSEYFLFYHILLVFPITLDLSHILCFPIISCVTFCLLLCIGFNFSYLSSWFSGCLLFASCQTFWQYCLVLGPVLLFTTPLLFTICLVSFPAIFFASVIPFLYFSSPCALSLKAFCFLLCF